MTIAIADLGYCLTQFILAAAEFLSPVADFVILAQANFASIRLVPVFGIV